MVRRNGAKGKANPIAIEMAIRDIFPNRPLTQSSRSDPLVPFPTGLESGNQNDLGDRRIESSVGRERGVKKKKDDEFPL